MILWTAGLPLDTTGQIGDAMRFDRNIITEADATRLRASAVPRTMKNIEGLSAPTVSVPSADDYLTKLLKYLPLEVLGAYLFLTTLIKQNVVGTSTLAAWLLSLLVFTVIVTCLYDYYVLHIKRAIQIMMSGVGIVIYVFASGDWFATTSWYHPWYGTAVLPIYGLMIQFIKLEPLPDNS